MVVESEKPASKVLENPPIKKVIDLLTSESVSLVDKGSGLYSNVYEIKDSSSKQGFVVKFLSENGSVIKSLNRGDQRYRVDDEYFDIWLDPETVFINQSLLDKLPKEKISYLNQLALQYEMHKRFLGEHIIPKTFSIVDLKHPILGRSIPTRILSRYKDKDGADIEKEILTSIDGKRGRILNKVYGNLNLQTFQQIDSDGNKIDEFFVKVPQGIQIVEIQQALKSEDIVSYGVLPLFSDIYKLGEIWDEQFATESLNFVIRVISMVRAKVSFDTAFIKDPNSNFVVVKKDGQLKIQTYDTNNWEVYATSHVQAESNIDPFPGVISIDVESRLSNDFLLVILEGIKEALDKKVIYLDEVHFEYLNSHIKDLKELINDENSVENISRRNALPKEEIEKLTNEIDNRWRNFDFENEDLHRTELDRLEQARANLVKSLEVPSALARIIDALEKLI